MALTIFDLDNTLIAGDSDYAWGEFLVEQGIVDSDYYHKKNTYYYQQYQQGNLDIHEYLAFALEPLAAHPRSMLTQLHARFMETKVKPMLLPKAYDLVREHQNKGNDCLIITATNSFVAAPICKLMGINDFIGCDPEIVDGEYTGRVSGIPSFQEGKIARLLQWLEQTGLTLEDSYGYSDSINDLPLLQAVANPIVVDGDDSLQAHARAHGWPTISLRD